MAGVSFDLMQTSGSQTTTENEDEEGHPSAAYHPSQLAVAMEAPLLSEPKMNTTVIQALGAAVSKTILEEEEALGKVCTSTMLPGMCIP